MQSTTNALTSCRHFEWFHVRCLLLNSFVYKQLFLRLNTQQPNSFINSAILLGSASSWLSSSRDQINISEEQNSNPDEYEKGITANYGTPLQRVIHPSVFRGQGMGTRLSVVQGNCGCWFTSKVPRIFLYSILIYFAVHGNI